MPDGSSSAIPVNLRARHYLQRMHGWVRPFWRHRLIFVSCALFLFALTASQTAEFMDEALLSCISAETCGAAGNRRITPLQFLGFMAVCFCFSLLLWRLGQQTPKPTRVQKPTDARAIALWMPAAIGGLCIVAACVVLIEHSSSSPGTGPLVLWPAASLFAGWAGAVWFAKTRHPRRVAVVGLAMAGFGMLALHPFETSHWWANYFLPSLPLIVAYCIVQPIPPWRELDLKRLLLWRLLPCFGIMFAIGSANGALELYFGGGRTQIWTFPFVLLLPACYSAIVVRAHSSRVVPGVGDSAPAPTADGREWLFWGLAVAFSLVACAGNLWPAYTANLIIAPAAMVAFIAVALLLVRAFIRYIPRPIRWLALTSYVLLLFVRGVPPAPLLAVAAPISAKPCTEVRSICESSLAVQGFWSAWNKHRPDTPGGPVLLVAAAGGGARAAAHTSAVLAAVDAATCGAFGDRVFAISGVSGGAVGSALYAASRADLITAEEWKKCKTMRAGERPAWLMPRLIDASAGDHLSAPLLRTLFRDLPLSLLMLRRLPGQQSSEDYASRAGALTDAWMRSYQRLLGSNPRITATGNTLSTLSEGADGRSPLLLFNATSVQDGMRVLLSNAAVCPGDSWCGGKGQSYLSMAMHSARFPIVTPAAAQDLFGWEQYSGRAFMTERSIVDGGYFDNTGVSTLLDVMDGLRAAGVARERIFAILITSDPGEGLTPESVRDFGDQGLLSQLLGPISTVVQTRDGRSRLAVRELQRRLGSCNVLYWSLSKKSLNPMTAEMRKAMKSNPEGDSLRALHGRPELVRERDPALGWALSQRSGEQLLSFARARALPFEFGAFAHANDQKLANAIGVPVNVSETGEDTCSQADQSTASIDR